MTPYELTLSQIKNMVQGSLDSAGENMTKGEKSNLVMIADGICSRLLAKSRKEPGEVSGKLIDFLNEKVNKEL